MTIKIIITGLLLFFFSCTSDKKELKKVSYGNKDYFLKVSDGGATTSFYWDISIADKGSNSEDIIFSSYSSPYMKDINVIQDTLRIICAGLGMYNSDTINVPLNDIDAYIENPVDYSYCKLKKTNDKYKEPQWVLDHREFDTKHGLNYGTN